MLGYGPLLGIIKEKHPPDCYFFNIKGEGRVLGGRQAIYEKALNISPSQFNPYNINV